MPVSNATTDYSYYWDAKKGVLLFELSRQRLEQEFIYFTGLSSGIGSIEMFANSFTAWQALAGPAPQRDPIFQLP